ncbi:hypothetical protein OG194_18160 [Streptomyces sp. NBC_01288]|uniref:hypothetical protein n=1 Tax=Streptomyces sp. NBC_01288 TaxID=2903814 RepID=UPI002E0D3EBB|nr:hypothetical protein OG194_18160 [Streptomyces sp. NBC_01288]
MRPARRTVLTVVVAVLCALVSPAVGWADSGGGSRAVVAASSAVAKRPAWQVTSGVPSPGLPAQRRVAPLACDTHAVGNWSYTDQAGARHNGMNIQVQVRDHLTGALVAGLTNSAGNFDICFGAAQFTQLYITVRAANAAWQVQNGTDVYNWSSPIRANPVPGSTVNFGGTAPGDAAGNRAAHVFDVGNDAWLGIPHSNGCWDPKDTVCRQVRIDWANDRTSGMDHYDQVGNFVSLLSATPDAPMEVMHEIGHALMDDLYNEAFPSTVGCPAIHPPNRATTAVCAWIEGWATYFSLAMNHTSVFLFGNGTSIDYEFGTWDVDGLDNGDVTERRVIGALVDLTDPAIASSEIWDEHNDVFGIIFATLAHHVDNTFASFWNSRGADGFDVSDSSLGSLYQNTIDYGYRRPLLDGRGQSLPHSAPTDNFGFNTAVDAWYVVALRPLGQTNYDLRVYDDRAQTSPNLLASSVLAKQSVDFVAIDSNLRPVGDYYPQVVEAQGTHQSYYVEYTAGFHTLQPASSSTFHLDDSQPAAVEETVLTAGVPVTISLTEASAISTASLFIMGDDPSTPSTFVQGRGSAVASAVADPIFGGPVSVTFTPTRTGRYGVVVTGDNGGGDYKLTRS